MTTTPAILPNKDVLIIGASRGLGLAIAQTYLERGARVVATARDNSHTKLHDLLMRWDARLKSRSSTSTFPSK